MASKPNVDFCDIAETALQDSKAQNIIKLDLFQKSSWCDYIFIATGTSSRHVNAIVTNLKKEFKKIGIKHIGAEGAEHSNWVILDMGDIIVHVFQAEIREIYKLEELWQQPNE